MPRRTTLDRWPVMVSHAVWYRPPQRITPTDVVGHGVGWIAGLIRVKVPGSLQFKPFKPLADMDMSDPATHALVTR